MSPKKTRGKGTPSTTVQQLLPGTEPEHPRLAVEMVRVQGASHSVRYDTFERLLGGAPARSHESSPLDPVKRASWQLKLKLAFHEVRGEGFQDLFANIMARRHRSDFQRSRPWSKEGDRKNDGYLLNSRTMFQVYGPDEVTAAETIKKIREDLAGALKHWDEHISTWVFVHNGRGLGPQVKKRLLDEFEALRAKHPKRVLLAWGYEELEPLVIGLPERGIEPLAEQDIEAILGPAVSLDDLRRVAYAEIQPVLSSLASFSQGVEPQMRREVPLAKMDHNALPEGPRHLLRSGIQRVHEVESLLRRSVNPRLGDIDATAYRTRYLELRERGHDADGIFTELWSFSTSAVKRSVAMEAAAWAVLTYFFWTCDIFEDAPGAFAVSADAVPGAAPRGIVDGGHEP